MNGYDTRRVFGLAVMMIMGAAILRILPHPPNFTPVAAMALFAGAHFDRKLFAFAVPLLAMLLSDVALELLFGWGLHATTPVVYAAFAATVGIGFLLRRRWMAGPASNPGPHANVLIVSGRAASVAGASIAASVLFFLTTNFGVWALATIYPKTMLGLWACYAAAIPFFGPTLAGDLLYTGLLFGAQALLQKRFATLASNQLQ